MEAFLTSVRDQVWGGPLLLLLFGTGLYLTFALRGMQFRYVRYALQQVFAERKKGAKGDISHFDSLMTSLAGAIGTGSIVGVATAVAIGGFGAIFWMWVTALVGMATKYSESLLAVYYRVTDKNGEMVGGPMEYIDRGLGWKWMAILFSIFAAIAAIGTGNLVQVNAIAESIGSVWSVPPIYSGIAVSFCSALVLVGGVKSIGKFAGILVPFMSLAYIAGGLLIILLNLGRVPDALVLIVKSAFTGQAASGGFAGASVLMAMQMGAARSVFSNEAGLGISSIAAAAAKTDSPARQGMITMTGALFSTLIVCTVTGLLFAVTGAVESGSSGATMAVRAFESGFSGGKYIVAFGLTLFAYSTIIAWGYYGEKCTEYLLGERSILWYRILYSVMIIPGAVFKMELVWLVADITNAFMAIPNLIALILLTPIIQAETRKLLEKETV